MRALVVAPQPFFSPRGTPFSVYYRTLVTAELGVEVDLLTYGDGEDVDIPGVRIHRIPRFPLFGTAKVGPSPLKAFLDVFILARMVAMLLRRRYDFVHAHEEAVFLCLLLRPLLRFPFVYDMHSSLPQQLTNFQFTKSKAIIRAFEWLENRCLRRAAAVITICPDLAQYAEPRMPAAERHFLIENSIFEPVRLVRPGDAGAAPETGAQDAAPAGRPLVFYAGTLEAYQGMDVLVSGFARARERCPDAFLLVVGGTPDQVERYRTLAAREGLDGHCRFTGRVDQATAKRLAADADVLTSPRVAGTNTPLKIYEQLASGKPLVATRIHSHTQVLTDDVAFLVDPDPGSIAEGLVAALTDAPRAARVAEAAKALYERDYSRPVYVGKMRRLLGLLTGEAPRQGEADERAREVREEIHEVRLPVKGEDLHGLRGDRHGRLNQRHR